MDIFFMLKFHLWLFSDYFNEIPWEMILSFGVISGYYISLAFRKCKRVFQNLKIILVLGFCGLV